MGSNLILKIELCVCHALRKKRIPRRFFGWLPVQLFMNSQPTEVGFYMESLKVPKPKPSEEVLLGPFVVEF